jgi:16S rRNA (cytosine1402-N4)-methyltransferase
MLKLVFYDEKGGKAVDNTHMPVMPEQVMDGLRIKPEGVYMDGTLGGAGHAALIMRKLTGGRLVGIDRDGEAVTRAMEKLSVYGDRFVALRGNFSQSRELLGGLGIERIDGALLDLGVSSGQLDTPERGFSYRFDARPDMRMDDRETLTAYDVVNTYTEKRLTEIMFAYGEERFAKRIARAIITPRMASPVESTLQLADIITAAVPIKARMTGGHPAKRVFQAIRIEVNNELLELDTAIRGIVSMLTYGGLINVLTFHSLEDRIVKHCFKNMAEPCTCPRDIPVCVCGKKPLVKLITRKPLLPSPEEIALNPRAHSAKLRIAERVDAS